MKAAMVCSGDFWFSARQLQVELKLANLKTQKAEAPRQGYFRLM
jgi:hypothetical protein